MDNPKIPTPVRLSLTPKKSIVLHHMMRSGGHAVLHWIAEHVQENLVLFDNLVPDLMIMEHRRTPWKFSLDRMPSDIIARGKKWEWVYEQIDKIPTQDIECFLYSLEDRHPSTICSEIQTEQLKCVLIRDPYNWVASRIKGFDGIHPKEKYKIEDDPIGMWKIHAKIALERTPGYISILYNQWFSSKEYRISISNQLGLEHTDRGLEYVPTSGGGSSFDGREFHAKAQQMDVLCRWKEFVDNIEYRQYFDNEIHDISSVLFPEMQETSEILKKKDLL